MCARYGIEIAGVTKGAAGNPDIARIMLGSGIRVLADSRLANIARLRASGISAPVMLLRPPSMGEVDEAAGLADIFLLSETSTIQALNRACGRLGKQARVIAMVDLGDLREGISPSQLPSLIAEVERLEHSTIVGIGANFACHTGLMPNEQSMATLSTLAQAAEEQLGRSLEYVSAGNSSSIPLMATGQLPPVVNHFRLGESLLLGRETAAGTPISGTHQNAFSIVAQVLEVWWRNVDDSCERGANALGRNTAPLRPGKRHLAMLNFGAIDAEISGAIPVDPNVEITGFSSDLVIADVTHADDVTVGDEIEFTLNYHALATAMSSPYLLQTDAYGTTMSATKDRERANV